MNNYTSLAKWKIYEEPIFKAKELEIKPGYITVTPVGQQQKPDAPQKTRQELFATLAPWLSDYKYTWNALKAAPENKLSIDDLVFLNYFIKNRLTYFAPLQNERYYGLVYKLEAFLFETIEFIIQGYSPEQSVTKAKESVVKEVFESQEPRLVKVSQLTKEQKEKYQKYVFEPKPQTDLPEGNDSGDKETEVEPKPTKNNTGFWLIAGAMLLIITRK